ncbi:transglycosylase family protein [Streptomyces pseudoechinosporeus]
MLSGNGRHRRPRQAPALFVAAGVTGSAIAIPLLGASGASAASGTTWDAVAECESGGSWSANSGNGEYGGLSMTQEEWEQYGGLDYAMSADLASRSQQIAVAEKILADQGTSPWATCGLVAGLTQNSDSADVDTGLAQDSPTPTPTPSTEADPGVGLGSGADSGSGSGQTSSDGSIKGDSSGTSESSTDSSQDSGSDTTAESPSPDSSPADATNEGDSDNSGQNADASGDESINTGDADAGTGRHRGGSAEEDAAASRTDDSAGRHASRADSASRDEVDAVDGSYTVRSGDSLWSIADSLDLQGGWSELYAGNKRTVGADPDLILPGQRLELGTD